MCRYVERNSVVAGLAEEADDWEDGMANATRRSVHRTQWASQFAVASELCKRGYQVAFTMGNHPSVDITVWSPVEQVAFGVNSRDAILN